eukprot:SAG22_NODE_962_length_6280_cov_4.343472_3_plen_103_part_00
MRQNLTPAAQQVALSSCVRPNKEKSGFYKGGIHAVINGFVCRFASQGAYFEQEGWISECPKKATSFSSSLICSASAFCFSDKDALRSASAFSACFACFKASK